MATDLEKLYEEAAPIEGYQDLPDGDYICEIVVAELRDNKTTEGQHLFAQLLITAGDHKGSSIFHRRALTPKAFGFVKADAKVLGLDNLGYEALKAQWPTIVGQEVACKLRTSRPNADGTTNQNSYLLSPVPIREDYKTRLLALAKQKGFADGSVDQMAKATYQGRGLDQLTTVELKTLGQRINQPQLVSPPPSYSTPDDDDLPF